MDRKTTLLVNLYEAYERTRSLRKHDLDELEYEIITAEFPIASEYVKGIDRSLGDILGTLWRTICLVEELKVEEE